MTTDEEWRFEELREEIVDFRETAWGPQPVAIKPRAVRVCLTCGAFVPTYARAAHANWHEDR